MKRFIAIGIMAVLVMMAFTNSRRLPELAPIVVMPHQNHIKGGTKAFMNAIAGMESDHNQYAVNEFGNLGKYQFSPRTLRKMGVNTTKEEFLSNETLQDSVMMEYMQQNYRELYPLVKDKIGTYVNGILITKAGILAGAHLVGSQGVCAYFYPERCHAILEDANGATIEMYMRKFGNYNISFE